MLPPVPPLLLPLLELPLLPLLPPLPPVPEAMTLHEAPFTTWGVTPTQCMSAAPGVGLPAGEHDVVDGTGKLASFLVTKDPDSSGVQTGYGAVVTGVVPGGVASPVLVDPLEPELEHAAMMSADTAAPATSLGALDMMTMPGLSKETKS
jgi:hypothetical protein